MMTKAIKNPGALVIARDKEQLDLLVDANVMLDQIQKGLAAYLEVKRIAFPRFFFLSNDEMLEILSETKDPTRVQPHLKKCFEGINSLRFEPNTNITGMLSVEGEVVPFASVVEPSKTGGAVEKWLVMVRCLVPNSPLRLFWGRCWRLCMEGRFRFGFAVTPSMWGC